MRVSGLLLLALVVVVIAMFQEVRSVIEKMAAAIQNFEGWYPGSRSYRNNNPGNLKFAGQGGAVGQDELGHAIFDSYQSGWNALTRQLTLAFTGLSRVYRPTDTLYQFFGKYAEANSVSYAQTVAAQLGVSPDATLAQIATGTA